MSNNIQNYDVIVIGAGAAGLMCAAQAGQGGKRVWLVDHSKKIAEKIRISGGGRCNFTNIHTAPECFLSQNKHFCKSALRGYTPQDFIDLVERYNIAWHEKKLGQLFCDDSAQNIIDMLLAECKAGNVRLDMETEVRSISYKNTQYHVETSRGMACASSLVIASGGLSIPKIGASPFGYKIAQQFGHNIVPTRAALVPLTFSDTMLNKCKSISGLSVEASVSYGKTEFSEGLLFTHRGLSGPSILQISSYWAEGNDIKVDLANGQDIYQILKTHKEQKPKKDIRSIVQDILPKRLGELICEELKISGKIAETPDKTLQHIAVRIQSWSVKPNGSEGYRTAEVTLGGVDTAQISSKTMESKIQPGLFLIGEVLDVTGHLGGFNFQWAWASAYAASIALITR